jgi:hypothetical protein
MLKFITFGHDMIIFHEHDIRKKMGFFNLMNKEKREAFLAHLNTLIDQANFTLLTTVIDKHKLKKETIKEPHVYHLAMQLGLEKLHYFLQSLNQQDRLTHIICEARGRIEDRALAFEFEQVCAGQNSLKKALPFELIISDKKTNSEGLQFADQAARPVGLSIIRPVQLCQVFKILEKKFYRDREGQISGYGLYLYPPKSEKPQGNP